VTPNLFDPMSAAHRQMDHRPLIKMAGVLASHAKIIGEKFRWHKHFSCRKRRFLCIKLRDLHSLSARHPQLSPQPEIDFAGGA